MGRALHLLLFFASSCALSFTFLVGHHGFGVLALAQNSTTATTVVDVGVILELESLTGKRSLTSISMAVEDFYSVHGDYKTRVVLHIRDSKEGAVEATAAAVDLLKNARVKAIIGPMTSRDAAFVIHLGDRTRVPVLSFSASSPSLSPAHNPFFVRATTNDSSQVAAIAAVVQHFAWRQAVLVYGDSEYGTGIVPFLIDALQEAGTRIPYRGVVPSTASADRIDEELRRLKDMPARVFVVHMLPDLGALFLRRAKDLGMMSNGYVWITTDGITSVIHRPIVVDALRGVIGVRPYINRSKEVINFTARFRWRFQKDYPAVEPADDPSIIQLWAYDTVFAVAMAVEKLGGTTSSAFQRPRSRDGSTELGRLGVSQIGQSLLRAILDTRFRGLAGEFLLLDGQLQSPAYEIVNVNGEGGATTIGFWTPENGITKQLNSANNTGDLDAVVWPGGRTDVVPKGWEIPTGERKLRIAVPVKHGFDQFVKVVKNPRTNQLTNVTGYCIDVFEAVVHLLPYPVVFDYIPVENSSKSYDNLIYQVYLKNFDAVVGDTTIIANRTQFVDFTMPYTESGGSMVVAVEEDKSMNMWIFLEPLTIKLWLGSLAFFVLTAIMVWVIEHRDNEEFAGSPLEQFGTIFYFAFSILVFSHKEKLTSNLTRVPMIICTFVVLILTSSYTASLTSMLTVRQLRPTVTDVSQLLKTGAYIGHQDGSYMIGMLRRMGFEESKLKNYSTSDQYADALSRGSAGGGVDAVFDEIPYVKLFLSQHRGKFTMVGPTYRTDGFGFVFPRGSPLVPDISRAILNVTEGETMATIEKKWFGETNNRTSKSSSSGSSSSSLTFRSFGGLFLITGVVSAMALLVFLARFINKEWDGLKNAARGQSTLGRKMVAMFKHYHNVDESPSPERKGKIAESYLVGSQSPESISNHSQFSSAS
ncbi:glutamate receptor 2.7 [Canna indica]|uniref:Glutamate receptor n=1 Tax=Canna indica TaxID=4628 RepID=A0AAQ3QBB9_9LILI|nr:glutamate receptor 2.7 [Canna indica]